MFNICILNQDVGSGGTGKFGEGVGGVAMLGGSCPVVVACSEIGVRERLSF